MAGRQTRDSCVELLIKSGDDVDRTLRAELTIVDRGALSRP